MCNPAISAPELYDDLSAILEALDITAATGSAKARADLLEKRAAWSASMLRSILGTSSGAPRSAAELRARLAHPATGCRYPVPVPAAA